jgi:hypothetical protein
MEFSVKVAASFSITYIQLSSRNGTIPEALAEEW